VGKKKPNRPGKSQFWVDSKIKPTKLHGTTGGGDAIGRSEMEYNAKFAERKRTNEPVGKKRGGGGGEGRKRSSFNFRQTNEGGRVQRTGEQGHSTNGLIAAAAG